MARMWELPTRELPNARGETAGLWPTEIAPDDSEAPNLRSVGEIAEVGEVAHGITHHRIRARVRRAQLAGAFEGGAGWRWASTPELAELGLTGMTRKILRRLARAQRAPLPK